MAWEENSRICLHMQLIAILSRTGVHFLGEGLAYGASAAAGTYSEGLLSGPAFVLGRLVGGYACGILGGDFGGAISGVVFDYFYY